MMIFLKILFSRQWFLISCIYHPQMLHEKADLLFATVDHRIAGSSFVIPYSLFLYMLSWSLKKFEELSVQELYSILQLRNIVFAIEQNCVYPDMDDKDQSSYHIMCWSKGLLPEQKEELVAYARILPPGLVYKEPSIGRIVTAATVRGTGAGKELVKRAIDHVEELYGKTPIRISAQVYLIKFYTAFGFATVGDSYIEDSIEHIEMVKS